MKNSIYILTLSVAFILLSCSDDTDDAIVPTAENEVVYNDTRYQLENGLLDNYGSIDTDNHYNIDFSVSDGLFIPVLTSIGDFLTTIWIVSDATIEVAAQLYSPGTDTFRTGTFEFTALPEAEVNNPSLAGNYFFNEAYVAIDTNGDQDLDEEEEIAVSGGTIQVSGTYPQYTLTYDLTLANGAALRGSFSGEYAVDE